MHLRQGFLQEEEFEEGFEEGFGGEEFGGEEEEEKPVDPAEQAKQYDKALEKLEKRDGPLPFYLRKTNQILVELSEDQLGKLVMLQASLASGAGPEFQAGDPVGDFDVQVYRLARRENRIQFVRPNIRYRWSADDPLALAASRSFPEAILAEFPIEKEHPEKKLMLVNVTGLFTGQLLQLNEMVNEMVGAGYAFDREKLRFSKVLGFPENLIVHADLHFMSMRGGGGGPEDALLEALFGPAAKNQLEDSRSLPLRVSFNLWLRNEEPTYRPRLADPRVGYFTTDHFSLSRFMERDRTERFVNRFALEKKDPGAAMSEPTQPIVWTLDPSIPEAYRPAVREGILRWNKAFEAIGFKNAIAVQDAPEDEAYDHADGRYNVVRWTVSADTPYAIALFRTDPIDGRILNASITFDANMLSYVLNEHRNFSMPIAETHLAKSAFLRAPHGAAGHEESVFQRLWTAPQERLAHAAAHRAERFGFKMRRCDYGHRLSERAGLAWSALQAAPSLAVTREQYASEFIADTISHEVGHCLGLRHNFVASTNLTTAQLDDDALTSQIGTAASVMDYAPVNIQAVLKGKGNFFNPSIGAYDLWAIEYGYTPLEAESPQGEKPALAKIASRHGSPGLLYMTDEDADEWNPYVVRFDFAKDPLVYMERELLAARRLREYAIRHLPRPGEDYGKRTQVILSSLGWTFSQGRNASRFVGGMVAGRSHKGDAHEAPTLRPVSSEEQRQAIQLIARHFFSVEAFDLPSDVMQSLSVDPNQPNAAGWTAPLRQLVSTRQQMILATVMSAEVTDRIVENGLKSENGTAYTLTEHYGAVLGKVFSEIGRGESISALRRDLQRFMLTGLMLQAGAGSGEVNDDVRAVASDCLKRLEARMALQLRAPGRLDEMTQIHLRESADTIRRFLARPAIGVSETGGDLDARAELEAGS